MCTFPMLITANFPSVLVLYCILYFSIHQCKAIYRNFENSRDIENKNSILKHSGYDK